MMMVCLEIWKEEKVPVVKAKKVLDLIVFVVKSSYRAVKRNGSRICWS